jgi:hypothetical protein
MREAEFREWLGKRLWKGEPLTKKATDNRVLRSQRAERGLQGLGFSYETLDQLFDDGKWARPCKNAFAEPSPWFQDERIGSVFLISQVRIAAINGWTPKIAISLFIL